MNEREELNEAQRQRARALLEQSAERLDHHTVQRLERARTAALKGHERSAPRRVAPWVGVAVAASLVAAVALDVWQSSERVPQAPEVATNDMELMTAQDDIEFYQDLEFYEWLESNEG